MGTVTAAAAISLAAAAASSPSGRRLRRGPVFVRCSSSAADERQALFSRIAPVYDQLNDVLSLGQHRTWKRICVSWSRAKRGDRVLDLCCGSGDLAFLLSQKVGLDGEVMAVDFSRQQLQNAADRQEQRWKLCYKNIKWIEGDALDLPFTGCYFDAVTVGYGLRNVVDKSKAMQEIFRVLKPGSVQVSRLFQHCYSGYGLTEEYKYLKSSIAQYFTGEELEKLAKEAGFSVAKHYELGGGFMGNLVATR
ncbi:2-phytyl-1,4-beta-naphthoquinone methyltransferase, chloroplastic isoform X2 [Phragmites australis]|uniref:2-phytyl-1,4-beta-naphthoquinone methyltransferase, chloroplastic isoform X2 n=1 Tax=Phragmites australis TaxID=29695 RepID=UPI002D7724D9|nr:2-phytyl-1,4-beta-naphthoquinone methyltransferase, chloroplastic isoform X2 [Phragmites australis]